MDSTNEKALAHFSNKLKNTEPIKLIDSLVDEFAPRPTTDYLIIAGKAIEQSDRLTNSGPEIQGDSPFLIGTLLGQYACKLLRHNNVTQNLTKHKLQEMIDFAGVSVSEIEDDKKRAHQYAQIFLDLGWEGCKYYPEFSSVVEEVEDKLTLDASKSHLIRPGFGFIMNASRQAQNLLEGRRKATDLQNMAEQINLINTGETILDWDKFLKETTNPDSLL